MEANTGSNLNAIQQSSVLVGSYGWDVRYLIELKKKSGKVPFDIYNVLTDKQSVMQLLGTTYRSQKAAGMSQGM